VLLKYLDRFLLQLKIPGKIGPELAEVLGVHIGDGCMGRYHSSGHTMYQVVFTASAKEYWYYDSFIRPTIESVFGVRGRLYLRDDNTTRYHIGSKDLVSFLESLGVPVGKKHDASIPPVILEEKQVIPYIRGVYHAEGSLYHRYSKPYNRHVKTYDNLMVIQIRMKLGTLMNQIRDQLVTLGISCNRLTAKDGVYTLRITSQTEIAKFFRIVRPKYKCNQPQ